MEEKNDELPDAIYGVACSFDIPDENIPRHDPSTIFFVTFTTQNESEAIELAKTFCGSTEVAKSSLILFGKDGEIY